jgi:hypothetical protein
MTETSRQRAAGSGQPIGKLAAAMRALGKNELPGEISVGNSVYKLDQIVKHDFFAATGFYSSASGDRAVAKFGRSVSFFGFPLAWIGRRLVNRELHFYTRLSDVSNVPAVLGTGRHYFVHAYIPGRPLSRHKPVPDGFFKELEALLDQIHSRNIAYVDTNKPENILLGDDQHPHLIDFQISWDLHGFGNNLLNRWILRRLQRADRYHILKHKKRMRPEQMTDADWKILNNRGLLINLHRLVSKPYFFIRRRLFKWLRAKGWILPEGSK